MNNHLQLYTNSQLLAALKNYDADLFYWENRSRTCKAGMQKKYCENKISTFKILYETVKNEAKKRNLL